MLVLSRKTNESILIGDGITIKIIEVRGGGVRIGIEAPKEIGILRSELLSSPLASLFKTGVSAAAESRPEALLSVAEGI
jgi:carbon storage regulator